MAFTFLTFQPVESCGVNYTLRNYTVEVDGEEVRVEPYNTEKRLQGKIRLILNSTELQSAGVRLDGSYGLAIRVCHDVVCKTSSSLAFSKCFLSFLCVSSVPKSA